MPGCARPRVNARVGGYEVDFFWPEQKFAVEVDGYRYHPRLTGLRTTITRTGRLDSASTRVTWRQTEREPYAVIARMAQGWATPAGPPPPDRHRAAERWNRLIGAEPLLLDLPHLVTGQLVQEVHVARALVGSH